MSDATTETTRIGPFTGRFAIGAAVVGVLSFLFGIVSFVDGYMELDLLLPGNEPIIEGAILLTFGVGLGVLALFVAAYMEP